MRSISFLFPYVRYDFSPAPYGRRAISISRYTVCDVAVTNGTSFCRLSNVI